MEMLWKNIKKDLKEIDVDVVSYMRIEIIGKPL
jgi:hypothetical protein